MTANNLFALSQGAKSHLTHGSTFTIVNIPILTNPNYFLRNPKYFSTVARQFKGLRTAHKSGGLLSIVMVRNLSKPDIKIFGWSLREAKEFLHTLGMMFLESIKKGLLTLAGGCYGVCVAAKSAIRRRNLNQLLATPDAPSVFFCVVATAHTLSMVALVGRRSRLPVSNNAGIPTPANVTTPLECRNSGGDSFIQLLEAINMATPTQTHPKFLWRFYSSHQHTYHTVTARTETEARRMLPNGSMVFTARIRQGGIYA